MIKINKLNNNELKVKIIIVCTLLTFIVFSFFFAENIEIFLNLNNSYSCNQTSKNEIENADYKVVYLDVGHGNSTYIKLPDGKTVLIDGGNKQYGLKINEFLQSEKIKTIDYLIATHADSDHVGGLLSVVENFEVKNIYRPFQIAGKGTSSENFVPSDSEDLANVYFDYVEKTNNRSKISRVTSDVYNNFIELIYNEFYFEDGKKTFSNITVFYDGLKITGQNYSFEFFAPLVRDDAVELNILTENTNGYATKGYGADESNGNSAIFLFSCYGETFLFTGDAPFENGANSLESQEFEETDFLNSLTESEKQIVSNVSVYLVGHHGSQNSSSEELLNLIQPKFVIISLSSQNSYGHPSSEVIFRINNTSRLEEDYLLRTDKCGNISFSSIDGDLKYSIEHYEVDKDLTISWYELGFIIFISISYLVVLVKPKRINNDRV